jgi:MoaA/NifB/PqqE/SkfB family radical SAM enzyme
VNPPGLVIVWRVTEVCDLGCRFCAYDRHLRRPRATADPDQVMAFGALLGEYAAAYACDVLVSWLGGEPLRWPPLLGISRAFKREYPLRIGVTTNGAALASTTVRERMVMDFDHLTISLDGLGPVHDGLRGKPGLYDQLRGSLESLHELKISRGRGPRLRVNTILMRDNLYAFEDLCRTVAEWGVEELTFNALGGRDRPEFYLDHSLRPEDVDRLRDALPGIRERAARLGLTIFGSDRYLNRLAASARNDQLPITDCHPGQNFLFVDERGHIAPCSFTMQGYGIHLSEIRTLEDLRRLPVRLTDRKRAEMRVPCYDCPSTQVFGKFAVA